MKIKFRLFFITIPIFFSLVDNIQAEVAFSFDNVNLVSVINIIAPEIGRTITLNSDIDEKITLIVQKPVSNNKIIAALETALEVVDLVLIEKIDKTILIKKNENLSQIAPLSSKGMLGVQLFVKPIKNTDVEVMENFIRQYFPNKNKIISSPNGQSLSFTGSKQEFKRFDDLINKFDVNSKSIFKRVKLINSDAQDVKNIIQSLIQTGTWLIGNQKNISVVHSEQTNSIIISGSENSLLQIIDLIKDLDKPDSNFNKSKNFLTTSKEIEEKETLIIENNKSKIEKVKFGVEVYSLKHAIANDIAVSINEVIHNSFSEDGNIKDGNSPSSFKVAIKAYDSGNQLIISGNDNDRSQIIKLIESLDKPHRQVYVEAIVAEISISTARELGLQFSGGSGNAGLTILNGGGTAANIASTVNGFASDGLGIVIGPGANTITDLGALINFIENDGNSQILATPTLLAMNNKEAQILVGSNIPIVTGKYTSNSDSSSNTPFQTISRQDIGIILKVKPVISSEGFITIDITQEVSELDVSTVASDVITTKRAIQTSAVVKTGSTLAVGGLINETTKLLGAKIPILGDLPVLKEIFNQRRSSTSRRNLVIFLKPTIVDDKSVGSFTFEKYLKLKERQDELLEDLNLPLRYPPLPLIENFK